MEFLLSPPSDPEMVVLLLIVGLDARRTVMHRLEWNSSKPLASGLTLQWPHGYPLEPTLSRCHMLMPLTTEPGFIIVAFDVISRFTNVLSGAPDVNSLTLPAEDKVGTVHVLSSDRIDGVKNMIKWLSWSRAARRDDHEKIKDTFYLCREDGMFILVEFTNDSHAFSSTTVKLDITNDTEFAIVDGNGSCEQVVTSNGVFLMTTTDDEKCRQAFFDWSPLQDFACVGDDTTPAFVTCSGRGQGLHSKNIHYIFNACQGRFLSGDLPGLNSARDADKSAPGVSGQTEKPPLHANEASLASGRTVSGLLVQVTERSIQISGQDLYPLFFNVDHEGAIITMTDVDYGNAALLLTLRRKQSIFLQYLKAEELDGRIALVPKKNDIFEDALRLLNEPTSICMAHSATTRSTWAAVGNWKNELLLVKIRTNGSLELAHKLSTNVLFESLYIREFSGPLGPAREVIAGRRDGHVDRYTIDGHEQLSKRDSVHVGHGAVTVDMYNQSVLAVCDGKLLRARVSSHAPSARLYFYVCFFKSDRTYSKTSPVQEDEGQSANGDTHDDDFSNDVPATSLIKGHKTGGSKFSIEGLEKVPTGRGSEPPPPLVLSVNKRVGGENVQRLAQLEMENVDPRITAEPQVFFVDDPPADKRSQTTHQPTHILKTSIGMVVAYQENMLMQGSANGGGSEGMQGRRQVFARVGILDGTAAATDSRTTETDVVLGKGSGEFIEDIAEWVVDPRQGTSRVTLIAVCTKRQPGGGESRSSRGRLYLLGAAKNPRKTTELTVAFRMKFAEGVHAAAQIGSGTFALCTGGQVVLIRFQNRGTSQYEFKIVKTVDLRAPGKQVEVRTTPSRRRLLYITTQEGLEILSDELEHFAHGPRYYDSLTRIFLIDAPSTLTLLLTGNSIVGLQDDFDSLPVASGAEERNGEQPRTSVRELFEAQLLGSISRVRQHPCKTDSLIACSTFGAFYQLRVLTLDEWRLLKYVQNMCEQDAQLCPSMYIEKQISPRLNPVWRPGLPKTEMHINGDILERLIQRGAGRLGQLVKDALPGELERYFQNEQARIERLVELMQAALQAADVEITNGTVIGVVFDWMSGLLTSGL